MWAACLGATLASGKSLWKTPLLSLGVTCWQLKDRSAQQVLKTVFELLNHMQWQLVLDVF